MRPLCLFGGTGVVDLLANQNWLAANAAEATILGLVFRNNDDTRWWIVVFFGLLLLVFVGILAQSCPAVRRMRDTSNQWFVWHDGSNSDHGVERRHKVSMLLNVG